MNEIAPMNAGMATGNGSVRSISPVAANSNNTDSNSPQKQQQQQQKQAKEVTSELSDLNENTWFSIGKFIIFLIIY